MLWSVLTHLQLELYGGLNMYQVEYIDYSGNCRYYEVDACNPVEAEMLCREAYQDVDVIVNIYNLDEIN